MPKTTGGAAGPRPYNWIVRAGVWVTVIASSLWAGGRLINKIALYLPYAIGVGAGLMVIGLILHYRTSKAVIAE